MPSSIVLPVAYNDNCGNNLVRYSSFVRAGWEIIVGTAEWLSASPELSTIQAFQFAPRFDLRQRSRRRVAQPFCFDSESGVTQRGSGFLFQLYECLWQTLISPDSQQPHVLDEILIGEE